MLPAPSPTHVPHSETNLEQSDVNYDAVSFAWSRSQSVRAKSSSIHSSFRFTDELPRNELSNNRSINLHKGRTLREGSNHCSGMT